MTTPQDPEKSWYRLHLWQIQAVRDLLVIAVLAAVVWLGYVVSIVTVPLLVALALAYIVEPLIVWLTTRMPRLGRKRAVLGLLLGGVLAVAAVVLLVVPVVTREVRGLGANAGKYVERVRTMAADPDLPEWLRGGVALVLEWLPEAPKAAAEGATASPGTAEPGAATHPANAPGAATHDPQPGAPPAAPVQTTPASHDAGVPPPLDAARVRALVREELERHAAPATGDASGVETSLLSRLAKGGASVLGFLGGFLAGAVGLGLAVFLTAFCFVYFSMSFPAVAAWVRSLVPAGGSGRTLELLGMMDRAISGFVRGRILVCSMVGTMYAVGWTLCGVPHGWLLGLATGLASLVPYLAAVGLPLAWLLLVVGVGGGTEAGFYATQDPATGHLAIIWWKVLLFPALVNVVAQCVEDYVLNPLIQGKATNLHPVAILLAAIAGGSLAGLYGLMLAIPAAACIKIMLSEVLLPRLRGWLAGGRPEPTPAAEGGGRPGAGV